MNQFDEGQITRQGAKKIKLDEERLARQNAAGNCKGDQRTPSTSTKSNDAVPFQMVNEDSNLVDAQDIKLDTANCEVDAPDCHGADGNCDTNTNSNSGDQNTNDASNDILASNMDTVNEELVDGARKKCCCGCDECATTILKQDTRIMELEDTNHEHEMLIADLSTRNTLLEEIMARQLQIHAETNVLLDQPKSPHSSRRNVMDVLDVANNLVCRDHLLSFLEVNDLLRLRRVSKQFKAHVDDFIRTKKVETRRALLIDYSKYKYSEEDETETLSQTIQNECRGLPIRTRAEVSDIPYVLDASLQTWLETWATNITHFSWSSSDEDSDPHPKFLVFLPNLLHLKICDYSGNFGSVVSMEVEDIKFPSHVTNLQTLKIGKCSSRALPYIGKLVDTCILNLERISLPLDDFFEDGPRTKEESIRLVCKYLFSAPKLKFELVYGNAIEELVRVDNRTAEMRTLKVMIEFINAKVISICNPKRMSFLLELPNLEEIDFDDFEMPEPGSFVRNEWPKLKSIKVALEDGNIGKLRQVWQFLFVGILRQSVLELEIYYGDKYDKYNNETFFSVMDILTSCPNLKTLRMTNSFPILVNPSEFWGRLPLLENLYIEYGDLTDFGFIGNDPENPAFWILKNLKVLDLWMQETDLLTDQLFSQVLCHMPLKELHLSSADDIQSITVGGIRSLLNGQFATTIERLSISLYGMAGVINEDKAKVASLFRSSQMI